MMEYDEHNDVVYIHNNHIWSKIESLFHLDYRETQTIMKVWLEETYKLSNLKHVIVWNDNNSSWMRLTNLT